MDTEALYQIVVYVPASHCEKVKDALFAAGAGDYGLYDRCCWQTSGLGQFRPKPGSTPFVGKENETLGVEELRLEMICRGRALERATRALKRAHPYETPAWHSFKLENF